MGFAMNGSLALLLFLSRGYIPFLFTLDAHIASLVSDAFGMVAWLVFFDGSVTVMLGILRGCGQQNRAAAVLFVGYFLVGLPLGTFLAFRGVSFHEFKGLQGIYLGLLFGLVFMIFCCSYILNALDWDDQVSLCIQRVHSAHNVTPKSFASYDHIPFTPGASDRDSTLFSP
jgi:Na+-driven multidrug efflux pump